MAIIIICESHGAGNETLAKNRGPRPRNLFPIDQESAALVHSVLKYNFCDRLTGYASLYKQYIRVTAFINLE